MVDLGNSPKLMYFDFAKKSDMSILKDLTQIFTSSFITDILEEDSHKKKDAYTLSLITPYAKEIKTLSHKYSISSEENQQKIMTDLKETLLTEFLNESFFNDVKHEKEIQDLMDFNKAILASA